MIDVRKIGRISSPFGMRKHPVTGAYKQHNGIDIAAPAGTKIPAALSGKVTINKYSSTAGYYVEISCIDGTTHQYMHMQSQSSHKVGSQISEGTIVGLVGTTGSSTGNHLHFGVYRGNKNYIDPQPYLSTGKTPNTTATGTTSSSIRSDYPTVPQGKTTKDKRITAEVIQSAQAAEIKYGVTPTSVTIAQWALESGFGTSKLSKSHKNYFGMKNPNGKGYQSFASMKESFDAHGALLAKESYTKLSNGATTPEEYIRRIAERYAPVSDGNVNYAGTIAKLINTYDLNQYNTGHWTGNGGSPGSYTEGSYGYDSGGALVLTQQISKLYSSDNYEFIQQQEKEETEAERIGKSIGQAYKNAFQQLYELQKTPVLYTDSDDGETYISHYEYNIKFLNNVTGQLSDSTMSHILNRYDYKQGKSFNAYNKSIPDTSINIIDGNTKVSRGVLLSYPSVVEAPTIIIKLGNKVIGGYGNHGDKFPNYVENLIVKKVNGKINLYTITLVHQVRQGEDPNFIDKLLSATGYINKISIIYGDSMLPSGILRDDEAIITDVSISENTAAYQLKYTITAMSSIIDAASMLTSFPAKTAKPSTLIYDLLYSNDESSKTLLKAFPGMKNKDMVSTLGLIPTTDAVVNTKKMYDTSPMAMLSYYVSGMYNKSNNNIYTLMFYDDTKNQLGGPYFKVQEIGQKSIDTLQGNYFELDVGYPGDNFVINFNINTNVYYPIIYQYHDKIPKWEYNIDDNGDINRTKVNRLLSNNSYNRKNVVQSNLWKKLTEYPIEATVTIKGLVKPVLLGSYIKINTLFYGSYDIASGIYAVIGQEDSLSGNGYRTTLSLLRVGN